jgi:hypothetical protein
LFASKVYPDGREELIRGVEVKGITTQSFKDIIKVGKDNYILNYLAPSVVSPFITGGSQYIGSTIITPSFLLEDGEVKPIEDDFPKPPFLANPLSKTK